MQIRTTFRIGALLVVLAFVAACSKASSTVPADGGTPSITNSTGSSDGEDGDGDDDAHQTDHVSGDKSIEVEAEDEEDQFYFKPSTIIGGAGQSIVIAVQNEGGVEHTFTIDDQDIDLSLSPEQVQEVTVTFPDSGSVEYYCRIHVNLGMRGELKVA
jgi:plastocyanin